MTSQKIAVISGTISLECIADPHFKLIPRVHYYECAPAFEEHKLREITLPLFEAKKTNPELKYLFLLCTVGSLSLQHEVGELIVVKDHVDLIGNPLLYWQKKDKSINIPNSKYIYSRKLIGATRSVLENDGKRIQEETLLSIRGPSFNTPAERDIYGQTCGVVGMSGATEAIMGRSLGLEVLALGIVTDVGMPETIINIKEISDKYASKMRNCICLLADKLV